MQENEGTVNRRELINRMKSLFNSTEKPIPPVRRDLQLIPIQNNGEEVLYVYDQLGYVPQDFGLNRQIEPILSLINGRTTVQGITRALDNQVSGEDLLQFIQLLDQNCLLHSRFYKIRSRHIEESFEKSDRRPAALAGTSYPDESEDLSQYLTELFAASKLSSSLPKPAKALFAPHIDLRVGSEMYGRVFRTLKDLKPARLVILATAHYTGYYPDLYDNKPFIGSRKVFEMPHGSLQPDRNYLDRLLEHQQMIGYTEQDRAHRIEHSIELHLLFIQQIWNHDFEIVPLLVNSFEELLLMPDGHLGGLIGNFSKLLRELDDENTFYLISGDLSHVGKKFGDVDPADKMKDRVSQFDELFLSASADNDSKKIFRSIRDISDQYRVCGFPPLYTFLETFPDLKGHQLDYHWWDEQERQSAVSFGAIAY